MSDDPERPDSPVGTDPSFAEPVTIPDRFDADGPMVRLLHDAGVTDDEIENAAAHGHLALLCVERLVLPDRLDRDVDSVADTTGLSRDLVGQIRRSLGFVEPDDASTRVYGDVDVEVLESIGELLGTGLVDEDLVVQMARVIGSSTVRIASALIDVLDPVTPDPDRVGDADDFAEIAPHLLPMLLRVIDYVWSRHLQVEARARLARDPSSAALETRVVGFADLVGFTALSQQLEAHDLARVVDRFETLSYDTVERHGGRVVKMIGDEVMFAVAEAATGAEIALELSETFDVENTISQVRVGLAIGPVLQREADLFGPVVNRASRIVALANPGSVLTDDAMHDCLAGGSGYSWRPLGKRNLKNIGRVPVHVLRRSTTPEPR